MVQEQILLVWSNFDVFVEKTKKFIGKQKVGNERVNNVIKSGKASNMYKIVINKIKISIYWFLFAKLCKFQGTRHECTLE